MRRVAGLLALVLGCGSNAETNRDSAASGEQSAHVPPPAAATGGGATAQPAADATSTAAAAPGDPEPPPDYGLIKPPLPAPKKEELTVHGLVGYEVVAVYSKPSMDSYKLGYMRIGTRVMVTPQVEGEGCPKGWHALPMGGFACASKGLVVDAEREPFMKHRPPPPSIDAPMPYEYAYVRRRNSPMWWRIPTKDELQRADEERKVLEAERARLEAEAKGLPPPQPKPKPAGAEPTDAAPDPDKPPDAPVKQTNDADAKPTAPKQSDPPPEGKPLPTLDAIQRDPKADAKAAKPTIAAVAPSPAPPATQPEPEPEPEPAPKLPLNPEHPWLEKGFFLSIVEKVREGGKAWWRTARGGYVQTSHVFKHKPRDFAGVVLGEEIEFPVGWVMSKEEKLLELGPNDKLKVVKKVPQRTFLDLSEETELRGKTYMVTKDGLLVPKKIMRMPQLQPRPQGVEPWERWIDVSLGRQLLVAYEGDKPVFVTLVSTGKKGTEEEPFDTPTGRWRIKSKHISTTMAGNTASDGNYAIQDVPWSMFFEGSYALHGSFWHRGYGYVRSHGCVNLGPSDARWLFLWTTPFLPEGWHGVHATEDSPGTTVVVRAD